MLCKMTVLRNLIKVCINKQSVHENTHAHSCVYYFSRARVCTSTLMHLCMHSKRTHIQAQTTTTTVTNMNLNHSQPINSNILYQVDMKLPLPLSSTHSNIYFVLLILFYTCSWNWCICTLEWKWTYGVDDGGGEGESGVMIMALLLFSITILINNIVFVGDFQNTKCAACDFGTCDFHHSSALFSKISEIFTSKMEPENGSDTNVNRT